MVLASCAMATVLALATVAPVAAGKGDEAASMVGTAAVSRIAATSASAPPSSVNVTLICRPTPDPRACKTALTSAEARSAGDPFAASVQFAMARATAARSLARNLSASAPASPPSGMHDCAELLDISLAQLRDALGRGQATTWLSAALTNQGTCKLQPRRRRRRHTGPAGRDAVRKQVAALARFISTALALSCCNISST